MSDPVDQLEGRMWDANVACKCLGKCPTNRYESLGLVDVCEFGEPELNAMSRLFRNQNDQALQPIY